MIMPSPVSFSVLRANIKDRRTIGKLFGWYEITFLLRIAVSLRIPPLLLLLLRLLFDLIQLYLPCRVVYIPFPADRRMDDRVRQAPWT